MSTEPPLHAQEKPNTCALACLRMVLAAYGRDVEESTLEGQARLVPDGTEIGALERLVRLGRDQAGSISARVCSIDHFDSAPNRSAP